MELPWRDDYTILKVNRDYGKGVNYVIIKRNHRGLFHEESCTCCIWHTLIMLWYISKEIMDVCSMKNHEHVVYAIP